MRQDSKRLDMEVNELRTHPLEKPRDLGAANDPNRKALDDDYLDTGQAEDYLRERWKTELSAKMLTLRRSFGKAPKFLKIGVAVRYRKADLDEFARAVGLSTKGFDEPKVEKRVLESRLRNGRK